MNMDCLTCELESLCSVAAFLKQHSDIILNFKCKHYKATHPSNISAPQELIKTRDVFYDAQKISEQIHALTDKEASIEIFEASENTPCGNCGKTKGQLLKCNKCGKFICPDCTTETFDGEVLCDDCYDKLTPSSL